MRDVQSANWLHLHCTPQLNGTAYTIPLLISYFILCVIIKVCSHLCIFRFKFIFAIICAINPIENEVEDSHSHSHSHLHSHRRVSLNTVKYFLTENINRIPSMAIKTSYFFFHFYFFFIPPSQLSLISYEV